MKLVLFFLSDSWVYKQSATDIQAIFGLLITLLIVVGLKLLFFLFYDSKESNGIWKGLLTMPFRIIQLGLYFLFLYGLSLVTIKPDLIFITVILYGLFVFIVAIHCLVTEFEDYCFFVNKWIFEFVEKNIYEKFNETSRALSRIKEINKTIYNYEKRALIK